MSRLARLSVVSLARLFAGSMAMLFLVVVGIDFLLRSRTMRAVLPGASSWVPLDRLDGAFPEDWGLVYFGLACLVLPLAYLATVLLEARLRRGIVGKGTLGADICLAPEAIEAAVVREVRLRVPEVVRVYDCSAEQGTRTAAVTIVIGTTDRSTVPEVQAHVLSVAKEVIGRAIGYADDSQVRVKVRGFSGAKVAPAGARKRPAGPRPFRPRPVAPRKD